MGMTVEEKAKKKHEYYVNNKEKYVCKDLESKRARDKACYQKNKQKKLEYAKNKYKENSEEIKKYQSEYYRQNSDKISARVKSWSDGNPELRSHYRSVRRQRMDVELTLGQKKEALEYRKLIANDPCYYCGDIQEKMHVDHVIPLARGGLEIWHNLVNACPSCNLKKNSKLPEEFIRSL